MSKMQALYKIEVKDKKGDLIYKKEALCKSFVLQFLQILAVQAFPSVGVSIKDVTNTNNTIIDDAENLDVEGSINDATKGIIVGTGTTAPTTTDYVMETPIAHGAGAGQLNYGAMSQVAAAEVGANTDLSLIRSFTNASGNTINVTEIGIYAEAHISGGGTSDNLILHEVVTAVPVANTQTLTVTIIWRTTV